MRQNQLRQGHPRQSVVCLVSGGALLVATAAGPPSHTPLVVPAVVLVMVALVRWRGRPLVAWIGPAIRFAVRPHRSTAVPVTSPSSADRAVTTVDVSGVAIGALADRHGLAAMLELGESDDLVRTGGMRVPAPASLIGPPRAGSEPAVTVQVLVVRRGVDQRAFVVVRVGADGHAWTGDRLRPALVTAVGGASRRLDRLGVRGRPLGPAEVSTALAWAVEGAPGQDAAIVEEMWDHLRIGAVLHTTVSIRADIDGPHGTTPHGTTPHGATPHGAGPHRAAGPHCAAGPHRAAGPLRAAGSHNPGDPDGDVLAGLLGLPATVAALAATATTADGEPNTDGMLLRLAAPTPAALATAVAAALADAPGDVTHLDGEQRDALAATLPLGLTISPGWTGRHPSGGPGVEPRRQGRPVASAPPDGGVRPAWRPEGRVVTIPVPGLKLGLDRHGAPVTLRLDQDRSTPIRLAVVGGPAAARVLAARIRALAPAVPVNLAVFDRPTAADTAALSAADVVVCQRVSPEEAALVAAALRLTQAGAWLSRIEGDMVAIIGDGTVRWALLTAPGSELPGLTGLSALART